MTRPRPPTNPFGPVLLALAAVVFLGAAYLVLGIGKDALLYAISAFAAFSLPVVIVFGVAGIVLGVRRFVRERKP